MMRKQISTNITILIFLIFGNLKASAQFYESGATPCTINWNQIKSKDKSIVYPNYYFYQAEAVERIMNYVRPSVTQGLVNKIDKIPVVLMAQKAQANGLVSWAPKRMELYTTPPTNCYSVSWLKQLTAHEYRHVVQMSNLNQSTSKALGVIIGQAATGIVTLTLCDWFFEGDATLFETRISEFGRGKQPEFSLGFRALLNEGSPKDWSYEKLKLRSNNHFYPSEYELGYFMIWAGQTFLEPNVWAKVIDYSAKMPFLLMPDDIYLKRHHNTNSNSLSQLTMKKLKDYWAEASASPNSSSFIDNDYERYREVKYPIFVDSSTILSTMWSLNSPTSFQFCNLESGERQVVESSVYLNSRPLIRDSILYWTEYKPSLFWSQEDFSVVKSAQISKRKGKFLLKNHKTHKKAGKGTFLITPVAENLFAFIDYDSLSNPWVAIATSEFDIIDKYLIQGWGNSVNGLAWDNKSDKLYLQIVGNGGTSLQSLDYRSGEFEIFKKPSLVTQRDLRAKDGLLYFSSIASGKDEAHLYNIESGKEYQLTSSKYGSFSPTPLFKDDNGETMSLVTSYKFEGYDLALQRVEKDSLKEVKIERLPSDSLSPKWLEWHLPKIDTIDFGLNQNSAPKGKVSKRRPAMVNPHSWFPLFADLPTLTQEYNFQDIRVGATVASQDVTGQLITTAGYGYIFQNKMSMGFASIDYKGLPVKLSGSLTYGGSEQLRYFSSENLLLTKEPLKPFLSVMARASLPFNFSDGRQSRALVPYIDFSYNNGLLLDKNDNVTKGMDKVGFGLSWSNYDYISMRDIGSRRGFAISAASAISATKFEDLGKIFTLYGTASFPGFMECDNFKVEANVQYQKLSLYNFSQRTLYPTGCEYFGSPKNLYSVAGAYNIPIAYPDGGIHGMLYFKKVSASLVGGYSYENAIVGNSLYTFKPYSYGVIANVDVNILNYSALFNLSFGVHKPSTKDGVAFTYNISVGF